MKIGFIHEKNELYTKTRMSYLVSKGHDIVSITFPSQKRLIPIDGVNQVKLPNLFINKLKFIRRLIYFIHIRNITKKYNLDLLHIVNIANSFLGVISFSKKIVVEIQGSDVLKLPNDYPLLKLIYKIFFNIPDAIIQDSYVAQNAGIKLGASLKNNEVIGIGIDLKRFHFSIKQGRIRKKYKIRKNDTIIFSSRSLNPLYNIDTILRSAVILKKSIKNFKYILSSPNDIKIPKILNDIINNNSLEENIIWAKNISYNNIHHYYIDVDIVVSVPSSDSSPASVYEAIACGKTVIVSDLPWIDNNFERNKHIITVPIKNEEILAEKIINVINNKIKVDHLDAYRIVNEKYNHKIENKRLEEFYYKLLSK